MADLQTAFLMSMAVVIAVAAIIVVLFHRFRQPLILGYLVAGMVVGPFITSIEVTPTDPVISVRDIVDLLARLGIVLLTFSIGLEFSLKQLRKIGLPVIIAATLETVIMIAIGFQLGLALGWNEMESALLGAMLSVSSTMIIVRALRESGGLDNERARLIVALTVMEDLVGVIILAGVSAMISTGSVVPRELGGLVLKMGAFIVISIIFGIAVVPRLVDYVGRQRSNELLVITVLALAFAMAFFAKWIGFSEAIGGFLMGIIVSESKFLGDVVRRIEPIRDLFGAMFFIAVGMLVNVSLLSLALIEWVIVITAVFVVAKIFSCTLATFVCGFGARNAVATGFGLIAIGEFSLMIAVVAAGTPGIRTEIYPIIVMVTTATALLVPYSTRYTGRITRTLEEKTPKSVVYFASYLNLVVRTMRRRSGSSGRISDEMKNTITRLVLYIVVMVTAAAFSASAIPNSERYAHILWDREDIMLGAILIGPLTLIVFATVGIWRRTVRLVEIATSEAMLGTKSGESIGYQATASALKWAFLCFYLVLGFVVVSPIVRSIVEQNVLFALVTIVIIAVAIAALWSSARAIDDKLEEILAERGTRTTARPSSDLDEIEDIIATMERGTR